MLAVRALASRPLLAPLPLLAVQRCMDKHGVAFDLKRPIVGPRPKRPWRLFGFAMDVDFPGVKALLKERDTARPEAQQTGNYAVMDGIREPRSAGGKRGPLGGRPACCALVVPAPHPGLGTSPDPTRTLVRPCRRLANEHNVSLSDDQRFWTVEPGPPPWYGANGKPRIYALRGQTMQERAIVQREELERRKQQEQENDGYFWTPPPR